MKKIFFILLIVISFSCKKKCSAYTENYIPKNLNETFQYFECNWSEKLKTDFKNKTEDELALLHHGFGTSLRNKWELWKQKNDLCKYFHQLKIYHPDDMSSIIIKSYHRKLNNKDINLKQQIHLYHKYWEKENEKSSTDFSNDDTDF